MIEKAKIEAASSALLAEWREGAKNRADAANRILVSGKVGRTRVFARRDLATARADMRLIDDELKAREAPPRKRSKKKRGTLPEIEAATASGEKPEEA